MRAAVLERPGSPDVLVYREVPIPAAKPGWVLIQVKAFGLNRGEVSTRSGFGLNLGGNVVPLPRILGDEAVGVVVEAPGGEFQPGQKVAVFNGEGMGRQFDGAYAEYALVPVTSVLAFETTLEWSTLAAMPQILKTAYGSLQLMNLQPGGSILIRGGTSGVGMAAAALAKRIGMTVFATSRSEAKLSDLEAYGVDYPLLDDGDIASQVRAVLPDGVDSALELIGTVTLHDTLRAVRINGVVCFSGVLAREIIIPDFNVLNFLPYGVHLTRYESGVLGPLPLDVFTEFIRAVESGELKMPLRGVYEFDNLVQAHRDMESSVGSGKNVVVL